MKYIIVFFTTLLFTGTCYAKEFSKEATKDPMLVQEGYAKQWCPVCGMSIKKHYKTSHVSELNNGTKRQYCSISCLVKDDEEFGLNKENIKVVDASSEKIIDANKAYYVLGSKIKGTMSQTSKLAFEDKQTAEKFQKEYGGKIVKFNKVFEEDKKSTKKDEALIKNKKIKKVYPMGKKIYKKRCNKIEPTDYIEINELKAAIINDKLCKKLKEKHLQAVTLYLWDVKRNGSNQSSNEKIEVEEKDRCPVCGMFVAKYPRWVAQIIYTHNDHKHKFSFDGVKDLMKFYFNPTKWGDYKVTNYKIKEIKVTDYYSQKPIDGFKAFYVIGSDVYGPMGNEFIPFESYENAKEFKKDHAGLRIISFDKIKEKEVYELDEFQK